jgi:hypothetical protein
MHRTRPEGAAAADRLRATCKWRVWPSKGRPTGRKVASWLPPGSSQGKVKNPMNSNVFAEVMLISNTSIVNWKTAFHQQKNLVPFSTGFHHSTPYFLLALEL